MIILHVSTNCYMYVSNINLPTSDIKCQISSFHILIVKSFYSLGVNLNLAGLSGVRSKTYLCAILSGWGHSTLNFCKILVSKTYISCSAKRRPIKERKKRKQFIQCVKHISILHRQRRIPQTSYSFYKFDLGSVLQEQILEKF